MDKFTNTTKDSFTSFFRGRIKLEEFFFWLSSLVIGNYYIFYKLILEDIPIFTKATKPDLMKIYSLCLFLWLMHFIVKPKKFMPGKEKGTARWADPSELNRVIEKDFFQNVLFTQTERLSTITRKTRKNLIN